MSDPEFGRLHYVKPHAQALTARMRAATEAARTHAPAVDRDGVFPQGAFAEIRAQRLLGMMVPGALGGEDATLANIVEVCFALGQACASTGLIFAMHQIKLACLVRHCSGSPALREILRQVVAGQLLLASSTTEANMGGDVRSSDSAIHRDGDVITLERRATVISYALEADAIVTTARRSADAPSSDQVLVTLLKSDYTLERLNGWDTLGMRGTRSEGFTLHARAPAAQVSDEPYEKIHRLTMVPFAHLTWGAVWMGIATEAASKAQAFIRHSMRKSNGQAPPGAQNFSSAMMTLQTLRAVLASALSRYEAVMDDEKAVSSMEFQTMLTMIKVQASELAETTVLQALRTCGLTGYRNDGKFSLGRHLRDILSARLMINNDRIMAGLAVTSLVASLPGAIDG